MEELRAGIDVGSTTVKLVIVNNETKKIEYSVYRRHNASQEKTVKELLGEVKEKFKNKKIKFAVCGSGGRPIAKKMGVYYIQEVVANAAAVCELYPNVKTAIELGGQDAKVIFFYYDEKAKKLMASDMRMNGSCAGGTGAFIDEIAALLSIKTDEFEDLAKNGTSVFDISGRCGVFAKTDIQPLLIQGAKKEDIALSTFHAIAKQTIGGLSQGLELKPPIIFEGGPLTFNPTLIKVFAERLNLSKEDIIIPNHPETFVAFGTAIAIDQLFSESDNYKTIDEIEKDLNKENKNIDKKSEAKPFFRSEDEKEEFIKRHASELKSLAEPKLETINDGKYKKVLRVYLGIDSGSTTSKFVLLDEDENVIDRFYSNNFGEPIPVVKKGISDMCKKYESQGIKLEILGLGTTGYGEKLFAKAFGADYHVVETVAHFQGCKKYFPDVSFLLDIGGQDMKAIWINDGIITNIMLNEACSSGCGSFLENFATTLNIPVQKIADSAFRSKSPANLGSRCTVFMNSTIINEQRNGKNSDDIMAGLCRSIIENVFTKVVRINNKNNLGENIVVQGGTFRNFAVLKALEDYIGKEVKLAPYPGEMGAVGIAIATKKYIEENGYKNGKSSSFIGLEKIKDFEYKIENGVKCNFCTNHCSRTILTFPNGEKFVTGNRCEKGEIVSNDIKEVLKKSNKKTNAIDMYEEREKMLFADYDYKNSKIKRAKTIGLPRVLEFWDSMPFWSTFFKSLGFNIKFSSKSSRELYENGIKYVASDTICFPAKLAHGHIEDLAKSKVDRIFMPFIMHMPPEGVDKLSPYVCSIVMGYPMVIKNSQDPEKKYGVEFDTPIFHWFSEKDRKKQIIEYAIKDLGVSKEEAQDAFEFGEKALLKFRNDLKQKGKKVIEKARRDHTFAVVLSGRPYHNDFFINHNISKVFVKKGISVLTVDCLENLNKVDLKNTIAEITNNFHTRMLESAMIAAKDPALEYTQIVSFGCGHDAILSDEIIRIMQDTGKKPPLILKVDESDAQGALNIRIESFIETIKIRRKLKPYYYKPLGEPSPAKFFKKDKKTRTLLIPNISPEVSKLLCGILKKNNFKVKAIPLGGTEEIKLGKKYVHNDICFPAQMVIGELIGELKKGNYDHSEVAVVMVKFQCDCRMSHYAGLLRKGLDNSGFKDVPILTTDVNDTKSMHPGMMVLGLSSVLEAVWVFEMLDIITEIVRKIRPYEKIKGETDKVYQNLVDRLSNAIQGGIGKAKKEFSKCIDDLCKIEYDRTHLKPRVFVTGELLVTYHAGSNFNIEKYLEKNGMEVSFPRITDQLRKDFLASKEEIKEYNANIPPYPFVVDFLFDHIQKQLENVAIKHPLFKKSLRPADIYEGVRDIIPKTLSCGEGWLMAAEIAHLAKEDVKSFIILQPFGCLPNHICGRGVIKKLKEEFPDISILPLDLDPDTSFANVENRLQMLIMNNLVEKDNSKDKTIEKDLKENEISKDSEDKISA